MAIYTNTGLVKHAEKALADKTRYMWGGIYRPITEDYIQQLYKIYGDNKYPADRIAKLRTYIGKGYSGVDCVGLVKSYYWSGKADGGKGSPNYGKSGYPDVNANVMFAQAKVKGSIKTIPEVPGLVVYSKSHPHVGVYIGKGYIIESTLSARGDGVIKTKLSDWRGWEYWFECPYIDYETAGSSTPDKTIKVGDKVTVSTECKKTYEGTRLSARYVANGKTVFDVIQVKGDRVVIGLKGQVTAAVNKKYLTKVG